MKQRYLSILSIFLSVFLGVVVSNPLVADVSQRDTPLWVQAEEVDPTLESTLTVVNKERASSLVPADPVRLIDKLVKDTDGDNKDTAGCVLLYGQNNCNALSDDARDRCKVTKLDNDYIVNRTVVIEQLAKNQMGMNCAANQCCETHVGEDRFCGVLKYCTRQQLGAPCHSRAGHCANIDLDELHFREGNDTGDAPQVPGVVEEYHSAICDIKHWVAVYGDKCIDNTTLEEQLDNTSCHEPRGGKKNYDCRTECSDNTATCKTTNLTATLDGNFVSVKSGYCDCPRNKK